MYQIKINGEIYELILRENRTAREVVRMLPLELVMQPYSDIEYYGTLAQAPFFDEEAVTMKAEKNTLMYCREYNALVVVCRKHHDIFREIPVGEICGDVSWMSGTNGRIAAEIREVQER